MFRNYLIALHRRYCHRTYAPPISYPESESDDRHTRDTRLRHRPNFRTDHPASNLVERRVSVAFFPARRCVLCRVDDSYLHRVCNAGGLRRIFRSPRRSGRRPHVWKSGPHPGKRFSRCFHSCSRRAAAQWKRLPALGSAPGQPGHLEAVDLSLRAFCARTLFAHPRLRADSPQPWLAHPSTDVPVGTHQRRDAAGGNLRRGDLLLLLRSDFPAAERARIEWLDGHVPPICPKNADKSLISFGLAILTSTLAILTSTLDSERVLHSNCSDNRGRFTRGGRHTLATGRAVWRLGSGRPGEPFAARRASGGYS